MLDLSRGIFNAFRTPPETPFLAGGVALVKTLPIGVAAPMAFGLRKFSLRRACVGRINTSRALGVRTL
jgi:hypothetical protein